MHQTLFTVPHFWLGAPLLYGWLGLGVIALVAALVRHGWSNAAFNTVAMFAVGAIVIRWVVPQIEVLGIDVQNPDGPLVPVGLAIRGYGVFLMLGILAGIGLCQLRAQQIGVDSEKILSLCFWLTVFGLVGARLFYVVQKWDTYANAKSSGEFFARLFDMTEGGLVVYGSLFGAMITWIVFCRLTKLSVMKVGDIIAPGMLIGLALGRIGCLMNGCCFGGPCEAGGFAVTFPAGAPAYYRQLETGDLLGLTTEPRVAADGSTARVVSKIETNSIAERYGMRVGDEILVIAPPADIFLRAVKEQKMDFSAIERNSLIVQRRDGPLIVIPAAELPDRSLRAYPAQLFSSINAFLLCGLLWFYYPFRRRDGELIALLLILYSVSRSLEELIRTDEPGVFFDWDSIGLYVSLLCFVLGFALFAWLRRRPIVGSG